MGSFGSAQFDTLTQLHHYLLGEDCYLNMQKPTQLVSDIQAAITAPEEDVNSYIHRVQKTLIDDACLCYYLFSNLDYTVLANNIHDTNFSNMMPVTMWSPADAWISQ